MHLFRRSRSGAAPPRPSAGLLGRGGAAEKLRVPGPSACIAVPFGCQQAQSPDALVPAGECGLPEGPAAWFRCAGAKLPSHSKILIALPLLSAHHLTRPHRCSGRPCSLKAVINHKEIRDEKDCAPGCSGCRFFSDQLPGVRRYVQRELFGRRHPELYRVHLYGREWVSHHLRRCHDHLQFRDRLVLMRRGLPRPVL